MPVIAAQLVLIVSLSGLLILLLVGSIALLSIGRQQRHRRAHHAETHLSQRDLTVALSLLTPAGTAETLRRPPHSLRALKTRNVIKVDIPEHYRLPVREGDPDEIVIQIDPDPISQDQRNVERLIAFLKSEMDRSNQAS
jgi:hypothetical protein